ncbi:hypothetical protein DY000_02030698 [Brassica cretica]|uniref:Reverse transcriptase zinc-binding domain-containing protein n=1 Tax=Brassica cretica TaxID=69181 RepID=A0ABQ7DKG9_BRACR|nr:hypothetical protein DY000_02030698 [Brassica cretica]
MILIFHSFKGSSDLEDGCDDLLVSRLKYNALDDFQEVFQTSSMKSSDVVFSHVFNQMVLIFHSFKGFSDLDLMCRFFRSGRLLGRFTYDFHGGRLEVIHLDDFQVSRLQPEDLPIQNQPVPSPDGGDDLILWRHSGGKYRDHFLANETWNQIRDKHEKVGWSSSVWIAQGVPRFAFITWLAVKNRLATGDRMRTWGIQ